MHRLKEKLSVLLVEDEHETRDLLKKLIGYSGFRVEAVIDGESALNILKGASYDTIIMDIILPGIDGIETTRQIRSRLCGTNDRIIKIIGLSGHSGIEIENQCKTAGMDTYLVKPINFAELIRCILER